MDTRTVAHTSTNAADAERGAESTTNRLKDDDWLADRAESLLDNHETELYVSLVTFIELFLVEEQFTFDAFHAALSGGSIISSDREYDELSGVNRIRLEPDENEDSTSEG